MLSSRVSALRERMSRASTAFDQLAGARDQAISEARGLKTRVDDARAKELNETKASVALAEIQKRADVKGHRAIEKMVNQALDMVFGGTHEFVFLQETKRGVTSTIPCIRAENGTLTPIYDNRGGGLEDVVSFVLQVLATFRATPKLKRFMVLDEPFSALSAVHVPAMADFLRLMVDKFGLTLVMVTHQPEFVRVAHRAYKAVRKVPGKTTFEEVTG